VPLRLGKADEAESAPVGEVMRFRSAENLAMLWLARYRAAGYRHAETHLGIRAREGLCTMKEIISDPGLVAHCGLYCGACGAYRKGRCPGCRENAKATWCKVRSCCQEREFDTCADCGEFPDPQDCAKYNNLIARIFGFVFRSDRAACIRQIREIGLQGHADTMAAQGRQSIRRGAKGKQA
jgi:hypothetical protein